jgi:Fe-S-cluster-containing hydrogenase component 2
MQNKIVKIDEEKCNGCGTCAPDCLTGAIRIIRGKARVDTALCDGAGNCLGACPRGAISMVSREETNPACGCPGSAVRKIASGSSELTHWPVQLKLVPATASFLEDADLLICADCVPCAYPDFHSSLLKGKVLLLGCPKLDDCGQYKEKIEAIVRNNPLRSITYAHMEVPCCIGLLPVIKEAVASSGKRILVHEVTIGIKGEKTEGGK